MSRHTYHWDSLGPGAQIHMGPVDECTECHDEG